MKDENCIFCKIVAEEIPSHKIYEDDKFIAFLDIKPVNIGHSLVVPKKHCINIFDTDAETLAGAMKVAKKIAAKLKTVTGAEGINIHMNNEESAGQAVFHTHIHVIPRYTGDGFAHWSGARGYNPGEGEDLVEKLK